MDFVAFGRLQPSCKEAQSAKFSFATEELFQLFAQLSSEDQ
jgi:hypothetical protein